MAFGDVFSPRTTLPPVVCFRLVPSLVCGPGTPVSRFSPDGASLLMAMVPVLGRMACNPAVALQVCLLPPSHWYRSNRYFRHTRLRFAIVLHRLEPQFIGLELHSLASGSHLCTFPPPCLGLFPSPFLQLAVPSLSTPPMLHPSSFFCVHRWVVLFFC